MVGNDLQRLKEAYRRDGFVSGVEILTAAEAAEHRRALEWAESKIGPLHYKTKVHTILRSPLQLATHPTVLDIVERLIGPDVLLYNVTYIVKEADTPSHVSWHQDLTYWGLSHDDQVSMWLALSPATAESGCMRMIPGSQGRGRLDHDITGDRTNVLFQGQTVRDVDESNAVTCPLEPGEASFHHGWTLHASLPNKSKDRRIGLNVQYFAAHVRQTKHERDSAMLVRGTDRYQHFAIDIPAESDLDPAAMARQIELENRYRNIAGTA
jgi:ectoine hydroxylase-related dioxygenase (phytanoyl-CoA dioxygenase family)